jgi:hypothetical protein
VPIIREREQEVGLVETFSSANIFSRIDLNNMSKVVAPLQSFSASGKIGKSLVFFSHLGRNVVRGLVTPANPKSEGQGDSRLLLGALGRAVRGVVKPSDYYNDAIQAVPSGQTWVSYFIRNIIATYGTGTTGVAALNSAFDGHSATNWEAQAALRGLTSLTIPYAKSTENEITAGAQLYALAVHAFALKASNPSLFTATVFNTALASWDSADVVSFVDVLDSVA